MAAMVNPPPAALVPQPTWVPYEPTRDCSQGLCSMYCPQWCYFIFPPPPPAFDIAGPSGDDDSSGPAFSPLVIAIIGVLASAFLLVSYYTIISKYCGTFSSLWTRLFGPGSGSGAGGGHGADSSAGQQDPWNLSPSDGMDETLINKITVCKYKRGDGFVVDGTDCSVCLGEFRDGESLRLLPKCSHAFHLPCIDPWLKSHSSCPLCRCNIAVGELEGRAAASPRQPREDRRDHEFVLTIGDYSPASPRQTREEPAAQPVASSNDQGSTKDERPGRSGEANGIVEIREDGARANSPVSVQVPETQREARMSIADVLQANLEDELTVAREGGLLAGSSRRCHGEHSKLPADAAANPPAPTKRLPPVGRSCFSSKSGRGKDSVPPM
ncbi:E3 ubiquitin-protein ligase Os04g0590900 [Brachypodium distachyon]|uniref:RING-type E3 ubiquitin transferase n=1 Tax=Brachypodium distachyon TaxID=15368 RepID=I1ICS6_BRADI|nr:E3 ubiquitin-protein ligase Os04g0590900 [Brachypodium distachyon]KQK00839.1 hypothetical protein BRADI_3g52160v3 [Brachypodium distachyon]|eukprot:XP_003570138.1 E3 ubiquitin-protein ligase Os04g0590900 [Brachypodium distachyon]